MTMDATVDAQGQIALPEIDGDRCVHALAEVARCAACVEACPRGAWSLNDDFLGFEATACDGCGLCKAACPEGAIRHEAAPILKDDGQGSLAFAACELSGGSTGPGILPCVHAIGLRDILELCDRGVRRLLLSRGDCATCPRGAGARLDQLIVEANSLLAARGLPKIVVQDLPHNEWQTRADRLRDVTPGPHLSRRGLLHAIIRNAEPSASDADKRVGYNDMRFAPPAALLSRNRPTDPYPYVPAIDSNKCTGCDACVRLCPHGAIEIEQGSAGDGYLLAAEHCSGCGLCVDVCDQGAVSIERWTRPAQTWIPLQGALCRACGVPFHMPRGNRQEEALCWICVARNHQKKLFQVLT